MNNDKNLPQESSKPERVFALVTDNEVFHKLYVEENYDDPMLTALIYGLHSKPVIIDITDKNYDDIDFGWTFDGKNFLPPQNSGDN
jgi:hypothetical protein